ncbi:DUF948 domain-containing protein [Brucella pseudogrignonensis]|uniref:DUF948 domain-containing protein n=1 Tax=Brucella pseudogrignonensis TaxID=419475 RepID=UPI001E4D2524|nr:DUF948 domain-containing protein [Brucella pseudogrignonensis]MCD4511507.1 DUF948 domain-containing protein [Brucella pseudogrignonensis]
MSDKPEKATPEPRKSDRLFYAVAIGTVLYFAIGFLLFEKFLNPGEYLEFYKWNALGDFLAGVFAPLAFVWLVAAVIVQREELKTSRQQFDDSQDVIQEQMSAIKSQNQMLSDQHQLAKDTAEKTYKLSLFQSRFDVYQELINFSERHAEGEFNVDSAKDFDRIRNKSRFVFGVTIASWLGEIAREIDGILEKMGHNAFMEEFRSSSTSFKEMNERYETDKKQNDKFIEKRTIVVLSELHEESIMEKLGPYLNISDQD